MDGVMPGHMSGHSEPPPCYNCGMRGHIFTACPEPTRATPAGLEASRARQQAGSGRSDTDHPNKRHKGPIVTRYSQPAAAHFQPNHFSHVPPPQHYPYGHPQPYPPGPVAPHPFQAPHGHGYLPQQPPPPPHNYGFGQSSSGPGPIPPPAARQPSPFPSYPPPHGHPPPGYPPMPPFGLQAPPPGVHGPPVMPPVNFHPPDYRPYTGPTPPPPSHSGYTSYDPQHKRGSQGHERSPMYGDNQRPLHNRHPRDRWNERHNDKPNYQSKEDDRFSRGRSRDERRHDRDRHDNRRSFDHRKSHRAAGERHAHRDNRDHLRSFSRSRSNRSVDSESRMPLPATNISEQLAHHEILGKDLASSAPEANVRPEQYSQLLDGDRLITSNQVNSSNERAPPSESASQEADSRGSLGDSEFPRISDQTLETEEDFLDGFEDAFKDIVSTNQGDAIAEPLPGEYTDRIMLPPAFDAKCVKSKFATVSNLDDFALSVRDTNRWSKYRNHPTFLPPEEVNLANLELYVVETHKGQNRHEKRGRGAQGQQNNREQGRQQRMTNSDQTGKNKRPTAPLDRKRKWDNHMHDPSELDSTYAGYNAHSPEPLRRLRQFSPEPGEISDTPNSSSIPVERKWQSSSTPQQGEISSYNGIMTATHGDSSGHLGPRHDTHARNDIYERTPSSSVGHNYDRSHSTDRDRQPMGSPSPYGRGRNEQRLSTPQGEKVERSIGRQASEHSERPLLDELQSHIDKVCSTTAANTPAKTPKQDSHVGRVHHPLPPRPPVKIPSPRQSASIERAHHPSGRPLSRNEAAVSRPSTPEPESPPSEPGSPLTRIEAELLGLVGADEEDDEPESKSPKKEPETTVIMKRKQRKVHSAYDRRW